MPTHRYTFASRHLRAFTLIEILVVVAIVGILAAMAVPGMTNSIVRRQIVEAVPPVDFVKKSITDAWTATAAMPASNSAAGLPIPTKIIGNFVSAVTVVDGAINITFGNSVNGVIAGKVLTLRPAVVVDTPIVPPAWVCAAAPAPVGMTVKGVDVTTVPVGLLPFNCK